MAGPANASHTSDDGVVFLNGAFTPSSEPCISAFDHGLLYGDGVFETLTVRDSHIFRLDDHLDRLYQSMRVVRLDIELSSEDLREAIRETARRNALQEGYLRVVITRGAGYPLLDPRAASPATVLILTYPPTPPGGVEKTYQTGLKLKITSVRKTPSVCLEARVKSLNYLNQIMARIEAVQAGADEAVMLDIENFVAEGPGENIFAVAAGRLVTPPTDNILAGITRRTVVEIADELGYPINEQRLTSYDLYTADEIFLSSSYGGILPVASVDGQAVTGGAPGPITRELATHYDKRFQQSGVPIEDPA